MLSDSWLVLTTYYLILDSGMRFSTSTQLLVAMFLILYK